MRSRTSRAYRRRIALLLSAVLAGGLLQATALPTAKAEPDGPGTAKASTDRPVTGTRGIAAAPRAKDKGPRTPAQAPRHTWPKPGSSTVTLQRGSSGDTPRFDRDGDGPVRLASAAENKKKRDEGAEAAESRSSAQVRMRILDRARSEQAGVKGLLFTVSPAPRSAEAGAERVAVSVDYNAFAGVYGGAYAYRMQLVRLPACALTTPDKNSCRTATPVPASNDVAQQTLTANSVKLAANGTTVLAATADAESDKGDYKATSLAPSASWNTNLNTGDFTWSYEMPAPQVPGGLVPGVSLSYSSGTIDGRTSSTNNQGSWVGDGFELSPGSIERRYKPCGEDGEERADGSKPGDLCWAYDNAFLSFNGKGGELVPAGKDEFKLKKDDGTR